EKGIVSRLNVFPLIGSIISGGLDDDKTFVPIKVKPLNTERTIIKAIVVTAIPIREINEIILITLSFFFEKKYRQATKKGSFIFLSLISFSIALRYIQYSLNYRQYGILYLE